MQTVSVFGCYSGFIYSASIIGNLKPKFRFLKGNRMYSLWPSENLVVICCQHCYSCVCLESFYFNGLWAGQTVGRMPWAMKEGITLRMSNIPGDGCLLAFTSTSTGTLALEVLDQDHANFPSRAQCFLFSQPLEPYTIQMLGSVGYIYIYIYIYIIYIYIIYHIQSKLWGQ